MLFNPFSSAVLLTRSNISFAFKHFSVTPLDTKTTEKSTPVGINICGMRGVF